MRGNARTYRLAHGAAYQATLARIMAHVAPRDRPVVTRALQQAIDADSGVAPRDYAAWLLYRLAAGERLDVALAALRQRAGVREVAG